MLMSNVSPGQLLDKIEAWEAMQRPRAPLDMNEALHRLAKAGLEESEATDKLKSLRLRTEQATPRVLASYTDLHGLDRLDQANVGIDLSANPEAAGVRALFQSAEIALLNINDLSRRTIQDLDAERIGDAEEKYRWISSFQQTMLSLSLLAVKLPLATDGTQASIMHSPHTPVALAGLKDLHRALDRAGLMKPDQIGFRNLHEPGRNLTHQAFVDTAYADVWLSDLHQVNVPGVSPRPGEGGHAFYERFVGTSALDLAVNELDQQGDNFLRQFRAYHQISEILAAHANRLIVRSIKVILSPGSNLLRALGEVNTALIMLDVMVQNVVPILRNLSVNKYQDIRGSLGITSGSHSPNIKHGLFQPIYGVFTDAVKARLMSLQPYNEEDLKRRMAEIVADPTRNHATNDQYRLMTQATDLHLVLKTWRDLHVQFVKTQIGLPPEGMTPTASISGSPSAIKAAHGMRQGAHGAHDQIAPLYEALLHKTFIPVLPFAAVFSRGQEESFSEAMLSSTAKVVANRSEQVQHRVHRV